MFERFTGRARQVVVLAQHEVRALDHNYTGTEHILLGLLREEIIRMLSGPGRGRKRRPVEPSKLAEEPAAARGQGLALFVSFVLGVLASRRH